MSLDVAVDQLSRRRIDGDLAGAVNDAARDNGLIQSVGRHLGGFAAGHGLLERGHFRARGGLAERRWVRLFRNMGDGYGERNGSLGQCINDGFEQVVDRQSSNITPQPPIMSFSRTAAHTCSKVEARAARLDWCSAFRPVCAPLSQYMQYVACCVKGGQLLSTARARATPPHGAVKS